MNIDVQDKKKGVCRVPSASRAERIHEIEIIEEVDDSVKVPISSGPLATERVDVIEIVKEIYGAIVVEVGNARNWPSPKQCIVSAIRRRPTLSRNV